MKGPNARDYRVKEECKTTPGDLGKRALNVPKRKKKKRKKKKMGREREAQRIYSYLKRYSNLQV